MTTPSNSHTLRGFCTRIDAQKIWIDFHPTEVDVSAVDKTGNYKTIGHWLSDVKSRTEINFNDIMPLFYDRDEFESKCVEKLDKTLFATCKTRKRQGHKEFFYNEAY